MSTILLQNGGVCAPLHSLLIKKCWPVQTKQEFFNYKFMEIGIDAKYTYLNKKRDTKL